MPLLLACCCCCCMRLVESPHCRLHISIGVSRLRKGLLTLWERFSCRDDEVLADNGEPSESRLLSVNVQDYLFTDRPRYLDDRHLNHFNLVLFDS